MANAANPRQDAARGDGVLDLEREALGLADRLPNILIEAKRIAQTVAHGIHGRRRAGPGETFWQFRQFQASDTGARSTGAARRAPTTCTCASASGRRRIPSGCGPTFRRRWISAATWRHDEARPRDRAYAGGGRAARARRRARRRARSHEPDRKPQGHHAHRRGDHHQPGRRFAVATQPPKAHLTRFSGAILFSDFLDPIARTREHIEALAADGATGHLIEIVDPAEETLPYEGRTEFLSPDGGERWVADRAQSLRAQAKASASKRTAPSLHRADQAARLVVPRASHRPAGVRAAADAHHAAAGWRRRSPLAGPGAAASGTGARQ